MDKKKVLTVEITRPGEAGVFSTAELELPATMWELQDTLEQARITDEKMPYIVEVLGSPFEALAEMIPVIENLYGLNRLAELIADMGEIEHGEITAFEALVKMDDRDKVPHTIDRLITLAQNTKDVLVAPAGNDKELGEFVLENEMDERLSKVDDAIYELLDAEKIGRQYRESEGGIFLHGMYAVHNGDMKDSTTFRQPTPTLGTVLLKVSKAHFNDPAYDNDLTAILTLPAADYQLTEAAVAVEASSAEECVFTAVDCIVPSLTGLINDELYASDGGCYGLVNELAKSLEELNAQGKLPTYKAMLNAITEEITLEDTLDLSGQTEGFILSSEMTSSADYAKEQLQKSGSPMIDELIRRTDLYSYGKELMEQNHVLDTSYGLLRPKNGQTLEQCLNKEMPGMDMGMK